ncbi:MAG: tRNA pseudouridine(13) synthase TruD [Candidatus Micrarchaeia archaeon]
MYVNTLIRSAHVEPIEGDIKSAAEDFVVEEITKAGVTLEVGKQYSAQDLGLESRPGKFSIFVLQKKNWNTLQALRAVAKHNRRGIKSVSFAGTKDRASISTQLCSLFGATPENMLSMHVKDIKINGAWLSDSQVRTGDLLGNRFTINIVVNGDIDEAKRKLEAIGTELGGIFPNYFGSQRFGNRGNNVDVGVHLLNGDLKSAALAFLTDYENEKMDESVEARKKLASEMDFKAALAYFPLYLKYERQVLDYLWKYPGDYANAMRRLPRQLFLMFAHSVESYIFNAELADRLASGVIEPVEGDLVCTAGRLGFPDLSHIGLYNSGAAVQQFAVGNLVGYETKDLTDFEASMLEKMGLKLEDFKAKSIPELNSKGGKRVFFAPYNGFEYIDSDDKSVKLRFSLPSGSYATSLLNEFVNRKE